MKKITDLHGKNIVVYDLETKSAIGPGTGVGWDDHDKMGISVGCLFDYETGDSHVYLEDNLKQLADRLNRADLVVGYNIIGFDNKLVKATIGVEVVANCYDMLVHVRKATRQQFPKGCKLNDVLAATFGMQKTEDGADAPLFFQRGEMGKLVTYCLADVRRERMAFEHAYLNGHLKTPTHGIHNMLDPLSIISERVS